MIHNENKPPESSTLLVNHANIQSVDSWICDKYKKGFEPSKLFCVKITLIRFILIILDSLFPKKSSIKPITRGSKCTEVCDTD